MRLQVFLSHCGVCSRRKALTMINAGNVKVNGQVIEEASFDVNTDSDSVVVDGKLVKPKSLVYILLNKPKGVFTTKADQYAKKTVFDVLPKQFKHLNPVGRLDKETEGLLLLTNDGDVHQRLTHPKYQMDKIYFVRIDGRLDIAKKEKLERGIYLEGKRTTPAKIKLLKSKRDIAELYMTIHEGRKRQIRIMFSKVGHKVIYLKRIQQGPLKINQMKPGEWRMLNKKEIREIQAL